MLEYLKYRIQEEVTYSQLCLGNEVLDDYDIEFVNGQIVAYDLIMYIIETLETKEQFDANKEII
jgi:hypothetical protein